MRIRPAADHLDDFVVEMARQASTLAGRPLPEVGDSGVRAMLPGPTDIVLIRDTVNGQRVGAAWLHHHEPALLIGEGGAPLPELCVAVTEAARGHGVGRALIDAIATLAQERYPAIVLNVHLANPATRLYMRAGFEVAGHGRGIYGVAMRLHLPR